MKKALYFLFILLFVANFSFGINVSVYIDNYGWTKISSEENISEKGVCPR